MLFRDAFPGTAMDYGVAQLLAVWNLEGQGASSYPVGQYFLTPDLDVVSNIALARLSCYSRRNDSVTILAQLNMSRWRESRPFTMTTLASRSTAS